MTDADRLVTHRKMNARRMRRERGNQPLYKGPCLAGCDVPGRGRSGYCRPCAKALWRRVRLFRVIAETALVLPAVIDAIGSIEAGRLTGIQASAVAAALTMLRGIEGGRLVVHRRPQNEWRALRPVGWAKQPPTHGD